MAPKKFDFLIAPPGFRLLFEAPYHKNTGNFDSTAFFVHFSGVSPAGRGSAKAAMKIWGSIHRLLLGVSLIALASGVLLLSDWSHRRSGGSLLRRVAVFQHVSQPVLDEGIEGMLDAIAESGFIDGQNIEIRRFNAENDLPTANAIAKQITNGEFDLLLTASTLSLQTVANANQAAKQSMSSALLPTRSALAWESAAKTRWITLNLWWASEALSLLTRRSLWPGGSSPACNP